MVFPFGLLQGHAYCLCDVVNDDGAMGVSVVHGRQRLVPFLTSGVPYLKLDRGVFVQCDRLRQESSADGRFAVVIKLVFDESQD